MDSDPDNHHRHTIRLKGYDYSQAGLYFITICCQDRKCLFGTVADDKMVLNDAGNMIERWYFELENKYPDKCCHHMIIMPNHFHCIIENIKILDHDKRINDLQDAHVGAPLRGRPISDNRENPISDNRGNPISDNHENPISDNRGNPISNDGIIDQQPGKYGIHNIKYNATIGDALDWFKTMTTNEYIRGVKTLGWEPFNGKLWQRNYYEHIIRNEESFQRIANYIQKNPCQWIDDKFFDHIHKNRNRQ